MKDCRNFIRLHYWNNTNYYKKVLGFDKDQHGSEPGADLGFSRGGGGGGADFQKEIENFDGLFFRSTKSIFLSSPKALFCPYFGKIFCTAGIFLKKKQSKNCVFSARAPPSKLVNIGAEGAFRKILGSVGQKWIS